MCRWSATPCTKKAFSDESIPDAATVYTVNPSQTSVSLRAGAASTLKLGQIARALSDTTGSGGYDKVARFSFRGTDIKAFLLPAGC